AVERFADLLDLDGVSLLSQTRDESHALSRDWLLALPAPPRRAGKRAQREAAAGVAPARFLGRAAGEHLDGPLVLAAKRGDRRRRCAPRAPPATGAPRCGRDRA